MNPARPFGTDERRAAVALALKDGMGEVLYAAARAEHGSAAAALEATTAPGARVSLLERADALLGEAVRARARILVPDEPEYPVTLHQLYDPPPLLFARGSLDCLARPCVAMVGTRRASAYGERAARQLATSLASAGATIVSGMALGIDAAAHRAALAAGAPTVAVLGTGIDIAYPAAHRLLHQDIAETGLLLSELLPGDPAHGGSFPKRNRIIAALSNLTIVVEAPEKSGALSTAAQALNLNRDVAAVPGQIDDPRAAGSNALLRDGAAVITSVADALAQAKLPATGSARTARHRTPTEESILEALATPMDAEGLATMLALPASTVMVGLTTLEIAGEISVELTGEIRRTMR